MRPRLLLVLLLALPIAAAQAAPGRERVTRQVEIKPGAWTQVALSLPLAGPAAGETWTSSQ